MDDNDTCPLFGDMRFAMRQQQSMTLSGISVLAVELATRITAEIPVQLRMKK
jgi:hypothetical protein